MNRRSKPTAEKRVRLEAAALPSAAEVIYAAVAEDEDANPEVDVAEEDEDGEVVVEDEGVPPKEMGKFLRAQNFQTNIDILECTSSLTDGVPCLDVLDTLTETRTTQDMRDCISGLCLMVNRLMAENQYIMRELHTLRGQCHHANGSGVGEGAVNRFNHLVFKRHNIISSYNYPGEAGIPPNDLNKIAESFDPNCLRANEGAITTLRRFVKFLLDNVIPRKLHNKFTVRERKSGVDHLVELPPILMRMIKDISLESVNLLHVHTVEDKDRQEGMIDYLTTFTKYSLQEMRRAPRKPKRVEASREQGPSK